MDLVIQTDSLPRMGETVIGKDFAMVPGGKGANQAVGAAKLGREVSLIGEIGHDTDSDFIIDILEKEKL